METSIRAGAYPFYATDVFPRGLARSSYFNKRESDHLICFGQTLMALQSGQLTPINEEESQFIADINSEEESEMYAVKLWKKYLHATQKSKTFHGFSPCSRNTIVNIPQDSSNDLAMELAG